MPTTPSIADAIEILLEAHATGIPAAHLAVAYGYSYPAFTHAVRKARLMYPGLPGRGLAAHGR